MLKNTTIKGNTYSLPMFCPDGTRAIIKSVDLKAIESAGVKGVVVNTYHLLTDPGLTVLDEFGGVKSFMNFNGLVISDSGGWQVFSLIHRDKKKGNITDKGVTFSIGGYKKKLFTPEKALDSQFRIKSDIMICLDDFTPPKSTEDAIKESVDRTILWAKRSKRYFEQKIKEENFNEENRPHLYCVVQGGESKKLRKYCADALREIGFDGYGFGGYLIDKKKGGLDLEMMAYLASIIPNDKPKFSLGTGTPYEIVKLAQIGWDIFDCTLPTRDARHKRLYIFNKVLDKSDNLENANTHGYLYIGRDEYRKDKKPISEYCDCYTCRNYSRAYLNHLFNINDTSAGMLATIHNVRTYTLLIEAIRKFIK